MKTNQLQTNIPDGWKFHKLDDLLTFVVDNRGKTPPIQSSGIPMAEVNAIGDKNIKYSEITKFVSEETYRNWFRKHLEKNDILFSTVGRTASCSIYTADIKTVIAQNLIGLRFGKDNPEFMFYLLTQDRNNQEFKNIEMSAAQPSVKVSQMIHLEFLVPPLSEQNRIVSVLETWDKSIEKLTQKIETKKQVKEYLMWDLLTGKKRLAGFKDKWQTVEIGELLDYEQPTKYIVSSTDYSDEYKTPVLTANKGFILGYTNETDGIYKNTPVIIFDDFTMDNKFVDFDFKVKSSAMKMLSPKNKDVNLKFVFERIQLLNIVIGEHRRHYLSEYQYITIDMPDIKEQNAITNILVTADKEITELEKKLSIIKEQKRYLLNNLITGTIRTPETLSAKITK